MRPPRAQNGSTLSRARPGLADLKACASSRRLGIAYVHPPARAVNVAHFQTQPFTQTQAQAIEREEEHAVTEHPRRADDALHLLDRDNVGQALTSWRLDQSGRRPGLGKDILVIEAQPIQVE